MVLLINSSQLTTRHLPSPHFRSDCRSTSIGMIYRPFFIVATLVALASSTPTFVPHLALYTKTTTTQATQRFAENTIQLKVNKQPVSSQEEPKPSRAPQVFRGVSLPQDKIPPTIESAFVKFMVQKNFAPKAVFNANGLVGAPKEDPLTILQLILEEVNNYKAAFDKLDYKGDYKFFGGGDHVTSLIILLKTNPFWASALTKSEDGSGFELIAFDPEIKAKDKSLFMNIIGTLEGAGHRVNFYFDSEMNFKNFKVYDDITGKVKDDLNDEDKNEWASSAIYNMLFYASCQHATIHVLHYLMTSGFLWVADHLRFEAMCQWARTYAHNIPVKYAQVAQLLIFDQPPIPAVAATDPQLAQTLALGTYAILTGPMGFGSSQALKPILKEMLDMWGESQTAEGWIRSMMNISINEMKDVDILEEFWKHYQLIPSFAKDTVRALRKIDRYKAAVAETELEKYLKSCGTFKSKIKTLENWIEIMSVTGIVHGCTLSYTRAFVDNEVLKWRNRISDRWDSGDMNLLFGGLGTIVGMEIGHHAMGLGSKLSEILFPYKHDAELFKVLDDYRGRVEVLKKKYVGQIMSNPDEFNNYGWILSDFCPDGFDGKQLTMTTYI